ncbi:MAG: hypothetical protein ACOX05_02490 [Bacillota bacterium]
MAIIILCCFCLFLVVFWQQNKSANQTKTLSNASLQGIKEGLSTWQSN